MASPPSGPAYDVAFHGWAALTVRIAWTLLAGGVRVRPGVLRDARAHVLLHLPPNLQVPVAEDRAGLLTQRFVARARRRAIDDPWPEDASLALSPRWRRALEHAITPLTGAVFRQHYGDGRRLESLERVLGVDRVALEAARGGLREVLRRAARPDGLPVDQWPSPRVDRLLARIAAWSPGPCPAVIEVLDGQHREHLLGCARCDRAYRLVHARIIAAEDLVPPAGVARPTGTARVLALHLHPDGRHHREALARECAVPCFPVGEDLLIIDFARPEIVRELVLLAAEVGSPSRDHLRGAVLEGTGRWSSHGLLGPLVDRAEAMVRTRSWGEVDELGELPAALPPPPSARRWWTAVGAVALLGIAATTHAFTPPRPHHDHPLEASFTPGRGGVWADFDVDDSAYVTVVREVAGGLEIVLACEVPADKAAHATGDGAFRVHAMGSGVVLASSSAPVPNLHEVVAAAALAPSPIASLEQRLRTLDPDIDVQSWRRER